MADPIVPGSDVIEPTPPAPQAKTFTEDEKNSAAAAARKDAEAKLKVSEDRLVVLETEKKEREEAELSENEKLNKELGEVKDDRDFHKINTAWREEWEKGEATAIEIEMKDLTENQKAVINNTPLAQKRLAIQEFKVSISTGNPDGSKGITSVEGVPTLAEVEEITDRLGAQHPEAQKAYRLLVDSRK